MTYSQQLRDPRWQRRRLEIFQAHNFTCEECKMDEHELGAMQLQLTVHHVLYLPGKTIWEYPAVLLKCLCWPCHMERQQVELDIFVNVADLMHDKSIPELREQPAYAFFTEEIR